METKPLPKLKGKGKGIVAIKEEETVVKTVTTIPAKPKRRRSVVVNLPSPLSNKTWKRECLFLCLAALMFITYQIFFHLDADKITNYNEVYSTFVYGIAFIISIIFGAQALPQMMGRGGGGGVYTQQPTYYYQDYSTQGGGQQGPPDEHGDDDPPTYPDRNNPQPVG